MNKVNIPVKENCPKVITCSQVNIDGLSKHSTIALDKFISNNKIDIIALQEVGSNQPADDVFNNKKFFYHHGVKGVGLGINTKFKPEKVADLSCPDIDATFTVVSLEKTSMVVGSCYCRPEINSSKSLKELLKHLDTAWKWCKDNKIQSMVIFGDFNSRSILWGDSINNARGKVLEDYIEKRSDVLLHSPGKRTFLHSSGGSVIDLSLSYGDISSKLTTPWTEHCYTLFSGAPQKGHIPVLQNIITSQYENEERKQVLDYDSADWELWHEKAKNMFTEALSSDYINPTSMFEEFLSIINECSHEHIPTKTACRHSKPYWSDRLSVLSLELQKAQKEYKTKSDPANKKIKEECSEAFKKELISEKNEWIHQKLESLNTQETLLFWQRYKRVFKPKGESFIGHLQKDSGLAQTDEEKEEVLFKTFFTGSHLENRVFDDSWVKFVEDSVDNIKACNWNINSDSLSVAEPAISSSQTNIFDNSFLSKMVELSEVVSAIKAQNSAGKCHDMDRFHPIILKNLPIEGLIFLTDMYNKILDSGDWVWNSSLVSFIKKADKDSYLKAGAFRPLTIASYIGKVFERILTKRLILFCQENNVIDTAQEGFLPNRSTTRYLYKMSASVLEARRRKMSSMLLFIDFEKAFDSVSISSMIFKLNQHGISGKFLRLIYNFLSDRSVSLRVNGFSGPMRRVGKYGLPQGSVLSPLLFVIFISDLFSNIHRFSHGNGVVVFKYADDGTIMVNANTTSECYNVMQAVCNNLTNWCQKWQLVVNCDKDKTEAVIMQSHDSESSSLPCLNISNQLILYVKNSKVLGVYFDDNLSFEKHSKYVLQSCWYKWHHLSDHTTRKRGLNCSSLILLFKTAVLTRLLYAAPIWLKENMSTFNNFIYKALFKISGSQFYPPLQLLHVLFGIPTLCISLDVMTTKFLLKGLLQDNEMRALILQLEETPQHPYYAHINSVRRFLAFQDSAQYSKCKNMVYRTQLFDRSEKLLVYSKEQMLAFTCYQWDKMLAANIDELGRIVSDQGNNASDCIKSCNVIKHNLFVRNSNRTDDTNLIDFIHGQGMRFHSFRSKFVELDSTLCIDCSLDNDTAVHKLFVCKKFEHSPQRMQLLSLTDDFEESSYMLTILFSSDPFLLKAFRDMAKTICQESIGDDCYIGNE